jgi:hypothetical protein
VSFFRIPSPRGGEERAKIVLFTTRSYFVSQMCRNTVTFVKTLFTDLVNSETTIYRERESRTDLCVFLSHPTPLFIENMGLPNYQNTLMNSREFPKWKDQNILKVHPIYENAIGLLAKLAKCPWAFGMGLFWVFLGFSICFLGFSILGFFGLLIIN